MDEEQTLKTETLADRSHRCGNLIVVPKPNEKAVAYGYLMFDKQGLLPIIFHEGVPSLSWFMDWCRKPDSILLGAYRLPEMELLGFGWIVSQEVLIGKKEFRKAELGEAFFRGTPAADTHQFGRMMIDWAFQELDLDVVMGTTPEPNTAAVRFAHQMGMTMIGRAEKVTLWQGEPCDAWLSQLTREHWQELRNAKE
jgi:hypothetical protein